MRCVSSIAGVQTHRFPDHDMAGSSTVAYEVGDKGEKNRVSWPNDSDVRFQSKVTFAVRSRRSPSVTPKAVVGLPPAKSISASAEVSAPKSLGPVAPMPKIVCRNVAPTPGLGAPGKFG